MFGCNIHCFVSGDVLTRSVDGKPLFKVSAMQMANMREALVKVAVRTSFTAGWEIRYSECLNIPCLKSTGRIISSQKSVLTSEGFLTQLGCWQDIVFLALAQKKKPQFASRFSRGNQMSWVRQRKILNCLLFFSAGTRKGSGERQMSLSLWIKDGQFIKCCCLSPMQRLFTRRCLPRGRCFRNIKWHSLKVELRDKHSLEHNWGEKWHFSRSSAPPCNFS